MKLTFRFVAAVCLLGEPLVWAQSAVPVSISFYALSHKPEKQARRFFDKGTAELKRQNYTAAVALFQKAADADPCYWEAHNNLGFALLEIDKVEPAVKAFEAATEIDPNNSIGWANLSIASLNQSDYTAAEKYAAEALRLNPQMREAKAILGLAMVGQGKWTERARTLLREGDEGIDTRRVLEHWPQDHEPGPRVNIISSRVP